MAVAELLPSRLPLRRIAKGWIDSRQLSGLGAHSSANLESNHRIDRRRYAAGATETALEEPEDSFLPGVVLT